MSHIVAQDISLDQIDAFFKLSSNQKPIETIPISSTRQPTQGCELLHSDAQRNQPAQARTTYIPPYKRPSARSNDYATFYQDAEEAMLTREISSMELPDDDSSSALAQEESRHQGGGGLDDLEISSVGGAMSVRALEDAHQTDNTAIYSHYNMRPREESKLPIARYREDIVNTIESNQVTVIEGPTGSGKTTQVPQYILDHYAAHNKYCNIIVTQPRRIAAMSIARRVCTERGWDLRGICGYQIGMDKQASDDTRLLFVTTQVLLRKLIHSRSMQQYTHVILDEVHERDQHSDFCLLVVRKLLRTNSRNVKVILMSATIDTRLFADYFKVPVAGVMEPSPVLKVEGGTFKVSEFFIEDLEKLGPIPLFDVGNPSISPEAYTLAQRLIIEFDNLENKQQGVSPSGFAAKRGSVLVFLPGLAEILQMDEVLDRQKQQYQLEVLPLHSSISGDEQVRVFEAPTPPRRKIILSTNIAESSITVPDIKYVIDFCLTKHLTCDAETYTSLQLEWASQANCIQRKGRAGRVSNGRVYRMITRQFWSDHIPAYGTPEMQRCPLEHLVLQVKLLGFGEPKAMLGLALSPPNLDDIERTVLLLKEAAALTSPPRGITNPHDGQLTFLGHVMAELPVDIHIGKLIMLGYVFGLLDKCVIIGAMLSLKSIFARPLKAQLDAYKSKLSWTANYHSDCIAMLKAYQLWDHKLSQGAFPTRMAEFEWGRRRMIQIRRLYDVKELVRELHQRLEDFNIKSPPGPPPSMEEAEETLILQMILCGAFYPNYFLRIHSPEMEDIAVRSLSGRDPYTTVMVKGLPRDEGTLYRKAIQELFKPCQANPRIHFEDTKAFVEFRKDPTQKAREFVPAVYYALKMRQLGLPLHLYLLDREEALRRKRQLDESQEKLAAASQKLRTNRISMDAPSGPASSVHQVELPRPGVNVIALNVTEIVECGHFWAHYADDDTLQHVYHLQRSINQHLGRDLQCFPGPPKVGEICLAPYSADGETEYYRARVEAVAPPPINAVKVFYLDYGNMEKIPICELRRMRDEHRRLKYQAFECELSGLRPSPVRCPSGVWTEEAKKALEKIIHQSTKAYGMVYSVLHGVVRLELHCELQGRKVNVNEHLIEEGFADCAEESLVSKQDHSERESMVPNSSAGAGPSDGWLSLPEENGTPVGLHPRHKFATSSQRISLNGPTSPYEMTFGGLTNVSRMRMVLVDRESVNSISLDNKPEDPHQQLLVAAHAGLNPTGNKIILRDTTLLPHIPGLPSLLALLFTPQVELRRDRRKRRLTGALCGLGWDELNQGPAFPDHDMEIAFDTVIEPEDISLVNAVRIAINVSIGDEDDFQYWGPHAVRKTQKRARQQLLNLLKRRRQSVVPEYCRNPYQWNQVNPDDVLPACAEENGQGDVPSKLYNLHSLVALQQEEASAKAVSAKTSKEIQRALMLKHIDVLNDKATQKSFEENDTVQCLLCGFEMHSPMELRLHLATRLHKENETVYLI